jgi:hypothetical protein
VKVDEEDVPDGTVLSDLQKIHSALESTLPGQWPRDVRQPDRPYRSDDVVTEHALKRKNAEVKMSFTMRLLKIRVTDSIAERHYHWRCRTRPRCTVPSSGL